MELVLVADLRDPLLDVRGELRQRYPAQPAQCQLVERFAGGVRQFQAFHVDRHQGLRVLCQALVRPVPQLRFRLQAAVRVHLGHDPVQVHVPVDIIAGNMQIVLPDRVHPGVHPAGVDRLGDRRQVPPLAQLTGHAGGLPGHVQLERVAAEVVAPPALVQAVAHGLQRVQQGVAVKLIRIADIVVKLPQHPVALLAEDVLHRLLRRAGRASADVAGRGFPEQDPIVQRPDRVLQLHRRRLCRVHRADAFHPPHDALPGLRIVLQPAPDLDPGHVRRRDARGAVPFLQGQAQRLRRNPADRRQAVSVQ